MQVFNLVYNVYKNNVILYPFCKIDMLFLDSISFYTRLSLFYLLMIKSEGCIFRSLMVEIMIGVASSNMKNDLDLSSGLDLLQMAT